MSPPPEHMHRGRSRELTSGDGAVEQFHHALKPGAAIPAPGFRSV